MTIFYFIIFNYVLDYNIICSSCRSVLFAVVSVGYMYSKDISIRMNGLTDSGDIEREESIVV